MPSTPLEPKPLSEQVIVITGASSGIGLATARLGCERGAKLVLTSRNQAALREIEQELKEKGGQVTAVPADVADPDALMQVARHAIDHFGRIDCWVNNAAVSVYGRLVDTPLSEKRRLFDVNFWGVIHGCRAALPHLRREGGTIINIGSVLSERAIPLQGMYDASKHAMKAYTDALRMELEADNTPVMITLIKPASINTPYTQHARAHMDREPAYISPAYAPEVVARTILRCAEARSVRDVFVGGAGKLFSIMDRIAPRLTDLYMERSFFEQQKKNQEIEPDRRDSLYETPFHEARIEGDYEGRVLRHSAFTALSLALQTRKFRRILALSAAVSCAALATAIAVPFFRRIAEGAGSVPLIGDTAEELSRAA